MFNSRQPLTELILRRGKPCTSDGNNAFKWRSCYNWTKFPTRSCRFNDTGPDTTFDFAFSLWVILKTNVNVWCESKILHWLDDWTQLGDQFCLLSVVCVYARKVLFDARKSKRTYLYDMLEATPEYGLHDYHCMICCIFLFVETLHDDFLIHKLGWNDCLPCKKMCQVATLDCDRDISSVDNNSFSCQLTAKLVKVDVVF